MAPITVDSPLPRLPNVPRAAAPIQTQLREAAAALVWLHPPVAELPLYTVLYRRGPQSPTQLSVLNKGLVELQGSGELARLLQRGARWRWL